MEDSTKIAIGLGVVSLLGNVYVLYKLNQQTSLNELTAKRIADGVSVDVPEYMVEDAVAISVERKSGRAMQNMVDSIVRNTRKDLESTIDNAVSKEKSYIKDNVKQTLKKRVDKISIEDLRRDVKEEARDKIIRKLDDNLDEIIKDFNTNLKNTQKIYSSISEAVVSKTCG